MRTTVDLPPAVHHRVRRLAEKRGQSLSATIAELTTQGLASEPDEEFGFRIHPVSGFPVISLGGPPVTNEDVAAAIAED